MEFEYYLSEQIKKHPSIQPQDVAKLCYQAAFGAEHLLSDVEVARRYLYAEFDSVAAKDGELFENISEHVCRVNLPVWKAKNLSVESLFELFVASAKVQKTGKDVILSYLDEAGKMVKDGKFGFSVEEWELFLKKYTDAGMPAVHHSEAYRVSERPAYRIVKRSLIESYK